jgi:hypothetical protein
MKLLTESIGVKFNALFHGSSGETEEGRENIRRVGIPTQIRTENLSTRRRNKPLQNNLHGGLHKTWFHF